MPSAAASERRRPERAASVGKLTGPHANGVKKSEPDGIEPYLTHQIPNGKLLARTDEAHVLDDAGSIVGDTQQIAYDRRGIQTTND